MPPRQRGDDSEWLKGWRKALSKASQTDNHEELRKLLEQGRYNSDTDHTAYDSALRSAVQAAVTKGKISSIQFLLTEYDAARFLSKRQFEITLQQAVDNKHHDVLYELLGCGGKALIEHNASFARHLALLAALSGETITLQILSSHGFDFHAEDAKGRTFPIQLAADKAVGTNSSGVVEWFVRQNIDLEQKDKVERNALHWAAATGKVELAKALLSPVESKKDLWKAGLDTETTSSRGRTALHLAAARELPDKADKKFREWVAESRALVQGLLEVNADPKKQSDGGWTPLHNAAQVGNVDIVKILLEAGADVNAVLTSGVTPLHWAATRGHEEVAKVLLVASGVRSNQEDIWGSTPMLRAAQNGHSSVVELFSPHHDAERLPAAQQNACKSNSFRATVTDFEYKREGPRTTLKSLIRKAHMYDVLYNPRYTVRVQQQTSPSRSKPNFRWLHIPTNNVAWTKTLFTKIFVEEENQDIEAFKALQKTAMHRGPMVHSTFMIPACTHIRSNKMEEVRMTTPNPERRHDSDSVPPEMPVTPTPVDTDRQHRRPSKPNKPPKITYRTPGRESSTTLVSNVSAIGVVEDLIRRKPGNVSLFMPYLHYEDHERRLTMSEMIRRRRASPRPEDRKILSQDDETLIEAYLDSSASLHPRRTLDQFLYHGFDTRDRDIDQVVYRYCLNNKVPPKVYMVDQLWVWIFGNDLVVTSFPQRWAQRELRNDPLNVLNGIIEDINSKTRPPVESVSDLAILIFSRCLGFFDRHHLGNLDYQFMDMFESSIGRLSVREPELFRNFERAASDAAVWLRERGDVAHRHRKALQDNELEFVTELLDIAEETKELKELKDIRDELNIIKNIFEQQQMVLQDFEEALAEQQDDMEETRSMYDSFAQSSTMRVEPSPKKSRFREQKKLIELHIRDVERMDRQAEAIVQSLTQLLDFKQKHANAVEAKVARLQAGLTAIQGETIMVFTIVTIVFLPMSFVAAFFTISIQGFSEMTLSHVAKFVFGIGLAISVVLVLIAFLVDDVRKIWHKAVGYVSPVRISTLGQREKLGNEAETASRTRGTSENMPEMSVRGHRVSFEAPLVDRITSGLSVAPSTATWRSTATSWRRGRGRRTVDRRGLDHV